MYEREEIEKYIRSQGRKRLISPVTQKKIDKKLFPSVRVRNTIEHLVNSGAIDGELAETWKNRCAVADLKKKAEGGDVVAMHTLGNWHLNGEKDLPQNEEEACKWYKKASENGDELAKKKVKDINNKRAIREKKVSAEGGDAEAMYIIGMWYHNGLRGLEQSYADAFRWYMKSSNAGNAKGMALAGSFMVWNKVGNGIAYDVPEGIYLLYSAAEKGSNFACYCLGEIYYKGNIGSGSGVGMQKNYSKAKKWLQKMADCDHDHIDAHYKEKAQEWLREIENPPLPQQQYMHNAVAPMYAQVQAPVYQQPMVTQHAQMASGLWWR